MRNVSSRFLEAVFAQETAEVVLTIARLSHASWQEDVLIVNDRQDLVSNGQTYVAFPFTVTLPDDEDQGIPVMRFVADNVSREIMAELRQATSSIDVVVSWVLASQPDVLEAGPTDALLQLAEGDARSITGTLGIEPVLDEPFGFMQATPQTTPGLF